MKKQDVEKQAIKGVNAAMAEQVQRVKANYRVSLTTKNAIIVESRKTISAALRTGIKSLLINKMSDVNVDMMTILFVRQDLDSANFDSIPEKYTVVRNGEFIQLGIDNFLLDDVKLYSLRRVNITLWYTDNETFETKSDSISFEIDSHTSSSFDVLINIFNQLSELL